MWHEKSRRRFAEMAGLEKLYKLTRLEEAADWGPESAAAFVGEVMKTA
jgi:hypothetical protein